MIRLARVEEAKLEAWLKRSRLFSKPVGSVTYPKIAPAPQPKLSTMNNEETARSLPIRGLTREQLNEKRKKGLCLSCDEPFVRDHVCKKPQLFMMLPSAADNTELGEIENCEKTDKVEFQGECEDQDAQITLHALSGHCTNNTI